MHHESPAHVGAAPQASTTRGAPRSERAHARTFRIARALLTGVMLLGCGSAPPAPVAHAHTPTTQAAVETTAAPAPAATGFTLEHIAHGAVLLEGLGDHHREITTTSPDAQAFFDQGLRLAYAFNHDEAARSFAHAGELDPTCAMCFWGAAYTLGPNYNMPMLADRTEAAWDALERAQAQASAGTEVEQALIAALGARYPGPQHLEPTEMQPFNTAYAERMRQLAHRFPDDLDAQVLFVEAVMDESPWRLWTLDGAPGPSTNEIVSVLESVLARDERHPGANHFYIHVVEASPAPSRAIPSAERLASLMPGAGHIVHMPAHIFQRVGRYADASAANRRAIEVDRQYLETVEPLGYYPFYLGHNYGFLAYSTSMEGRRAEALEAARHSAESIPRDLVCGMPGMDFFLSEPLLVMVRFGLWDELVAEPQPEARHPVLRALWHHAHGMALASLGQLDEALADLSTLRRMASETPDDVLAGLNAGRNVLELAGLVLEARIAERTGSPDAIALWERAVALEDRLAYNEPADWFYPTRHYLGAALLDAGRATDAVGVYRADLRRHPMNGWALFGLEQALRLQGREEDADGTRSLRDRAWASADTTLTRSAF